MKRIHLTDEEKVIEDQAEKLRPLSSGEKKRIERIIDRARKSQAISLRVSSYDLDRLKERAEQEGLPYQTFINAILHKYITNQLYDKNELMKTLGVVKEKQAT